MQQDSLTQRRIQSHVKRVMDELETLYEKRPSKRFIDEFALAEGELYARLASAKLSNLEIEQAFTKFRTRMLKAL